jgi:NAD(P)-dependent dehydrogenase (short-subunit alcohol dehydrogenase family)
MLRSVNPYAEAAHCRSVIDSAVAEFGRVDVLVRNAAQQMTHDKLEDISDEEWDRTLAVNLSAFFYLTKDALPHMRPGSSIIGTSSVNSDAPTPQLLPYDVTKAGIANMTAALAQLLADRGIRANGVAPGPVWTPLIPSTMPALISASVPLAAVRCLRRPLAVVAPAAGEAVQVPDSAAGRSG